ncbi:hypothetical protein HMPREF1550_01011 [Actinomyces sp. oral taxon 877 str. F0543]|nr:hypothetical protein HMPREF1550_01011 [Actinomyces sp. oral taxon 877 str. F0543]
MREKANGPELLLGALLYPRPLFASRGRAAGVFIVGAGGPTRSRRRRMGCA